MNKKTIIILLAVSAVVFAMFRPDKFITGMMAYRDFSIKGFPKEYNGIKLDKKSFIYANNYKNFYPTLFFRNSISDYIFFKMEVSVDDIKTVVYQPIHNLNPVFGGYEFTNGDLDFSLENHKKTAESLIIAGNNIKSNSSQNSEIFEIEGDFEIFQDKNLLFSYRPKERSKIFIYIKKTQIPLFYIIESDSLSKDQILKTF